MHTGKKRTLSHVENKNYKERKHLKKRKRRASIKNYELIKRYQGKGDTKNEGEEGGFWSRGRAH